MNETTAPESTSGLDGGTPSQAWPEIPAGADPQVVAAAGRRAVARFADALEQAVNELPPDATLDDLRREALQIAQAARQVYSDVVDGDDPQGSDGPIATPPQADERSGFDVNPDGARCLGCATLSESDPFVSPARIATGDPAEVEAWMRAHEPACPALHPELRIVLT